jgi:hypothetical protein
MATAIMAARIVSPPPIVSMGADGQNVSINLDATGSTASPGQQLTSYAWTVTAQLGGVPLVFFQEAVQQPNAAFVSLPVGSYIVNLIVKDTAGRNASITQVSGVPYTLPARSAASASVERQALYNVLCQPLLH